jgi:hypothetical protein
MSDESAQPVKEQQATPGQNDSQARSQTYNQIAATHIDTLSKINAVETSGQKDEPDSTKARQQALWTMSMYVGFSIKLVREELSKQINDLEQYGVIPAKHPKYTAMPKTGQAANAAAAEASVKNGGYGDFDVGVLNARAASGHVGGDDVLDRVKAMVEELAKRSEVEADGEAMAVDG